MRDSGGGSAKALMPKVEGGKMVLSGVGLVLSQADTGSELGYRRHYCMAVKETTLSCEAQSMYSVLNRKAAQ